MSKSKRGSARRAAPGAAGPSAGAVRSSGPGPVQSPRPRPKQRSRRALVGLLATLFFVAVAAVAGLLLGRNSAAKGVSLGGGQQIALPGQAAGKAGAAVGDLGPATPFSIQTLAGETFSLKPRQGPVVLSFIAGWCGSCLAEAEAGGRIVRAFGAKGVRVLAIDADPSDSRGQLEQFINAAGNPPIQFAMDRTSEVTIAYKVRALDTTVIIDREGKIVYRDEWPTDYETLARVVSTVVR